jgi:hypothetical protein
MSAELPDDGVHVRTFYHLSTEDCSICKLSVEIYPLTLEVAQILADAIKHKTNHCLSTLQVVSGEITDLTAGKAN